MKFGVCYYAQIHANSPQPLRAPDDRPVDDDEDYSEDVNGQNSKVAYSLKAHMRKIEDDNRLLRTISEKLRWSNYH